MYRILATTNHARDFVMKSVGKYLQFSTKEKALEWIKEHKTPGTVYKAKEIKSRQAAPLNRKRRKARKPVKVVSFEVLVETGVIQ